MYGGLDDVTAAVRAFGADTVAVLACPEMDGVKLRALAWELEKTGTDLCLSPALLDVAGPRTTIRPTAGLTLLHVDHPQLSGFRLVIKDLFDRSVAAAALILLFPLLAVLGMMIWLHDRGPALFTQTRVGKDGRAFRIYKFRTMVVDAEQRRAQLLASNELDGVLFKLRRDPRVTADRGCTCGAGRSTSSRSSSTCSSATCRWWARARPFLPRQPNTPTTSAAGSWSSQALPASGR